MSVASQEGGLGAPLRHVIDWQAEAFTDPDKMESVVRRYLVKAQVDQFQSESGSGSIALSMLGDTASMMASWNPTDWKV